MKNKPKKIKKEKKISVGHKGRRKEEEEEEEKKEKEINAEN